MKLMKPSTLRKIAVVVFLIAAVAIFSPLNLADNRVFVGGVIAFAILVAAALVYTQITGKRFPFNPFF